MALAGGANVESIFSVERFGFRSSDSAFKSVLVSARAA
jgi:hypothetical protein